MTSRLKMLFNSTVLNFLAIIFIIGNLSFVIFNNPIAAQVELLAIIGIVFYLAWFIAAKPASVHTNRWVSRCACGIFWVTLLAVGLKFDLPMLLGIVSAAAAVTFIGFALNASYSSLADVQEVEVQKIYLTDDKQTSHIK